MTKFKSKHVSKDILNNNIKSPPNRYERAYQSLFKKLTPDVQSRVLDLKQNPDSRDFEANKFINDVMRLAESEDEIAN